MLLFLAKFYIHKCTFSKKTLSFLFFNKDFVIYFNSLKNSKSSISCKTLQCCKSYKLLWYSFFFFCMLQKKLSCFCICYYCINKKGLTNLWLTNDKSLCNFLLLYERVIFFVLFFYYGKSSENEAHIINLVIKLKFHIHLCKLSIYNYIVSIMESTNKKRLKQFLYLIHLIFCEIWPFIILFICFFLFSYYYYFGSFIYMYFIVYIFYYMYTLGMHCYVICDLFIIIISILLLYLSNLYWLCSYTEIYYFIIWKLKIYFLKILYKTLIC